MIMEIIIISFIVSLCVFNLKNIGKLFSAIGYAAGLLCIIACNKKSKGEMDER